jgi:hypothetical protein
MKKAFITGLVLLSFAVNGAFAQASAPSSGSALDPGLILVGGGSDASLYYSLSTSSDSGAFAFSVYGWGGYTLAGGMNIGPYLGVSYNTGFSMSPGIQLSYYMSSGSSLFFIRSIDRLNFGSSSGDFSLNGFSTELALGVSPQITDYLLLDVGPYLYLYSSTGLDYLYLQVGLEVGLVVLL